MRPIQNVGGQVGLTAREYPIAAATAVQRGQVVCLSGGLVTPAAPAQTGAILGIAAEDHPGTADVLQPRADGTVLLVYDNPGLIVECPAPEVTAVSGSATTVVASGACLSGALADGAFSGGLLKLKSKAAAGANTDPAGALKRVADYAKATYTFTVPAAGTADAGDVYQVFPPVGFSALALDADLLRGIVTSTGATAIRVVGADTERGMIRCMAALHTLAAEY